MKNRISYYLGQNGYLKMITNLSEFTIYFKKENGFVSMVEVVDMKDNPYITEDMFHNVIQKAQWRFRDQGIEEIHYLVLVLGEDMERAAALGEREYFFWMINSEAKELCIPEGKAEDFYGMKGQIEEWLKADFDSMVSTEEASYGADGRRIRNFREQPLVNHGIFLINVIVFTLCTLSGDLLYTYGELKLLEVESGQWYRMITCMFLHGDMSHLIGNMIVLFFLGNIVEKELGHIKYFILYFLSGLAGGFASLFAQNARMYMGMELVGSIGASGAIFGMLGSLLWLLIRNKGKLAELSFMRVLFLVCYTLYGGLTSTNVDNAAHFGGLLAGFFLAIIIYRKKKRKKEKEGIL